MTLYVAGQVLKTTKRTPYAYLGGQQVKSDVRALFRRLGNDPKGKQKHRLLEGVAVHYFASGDWGAWVLHDEPGRHKGTPHILSVNPEVPSPLPYYHTTKSIMGE